MDPEVSQRVTEQVASLYGLTGVALTSHVENMPDYHFHAQAVLLELLYRSQGASASDMLVQVDAPIIDGNTQKSLAKWRQKANSLKKSDAVYDRWFKAQAERIIEGKRIESICQYSEMPPNMVTLEGKACELCGIPPYQLRGFYYELPHRMARVFAICYLLASGGNEVKINELDYTGWTRVDTPYAALGTTLFEAICRYELFDSATCDQFWSALQYLLSENPNAFRLKETHYLPDGHPVPAGTEWYDVTPEHAVDQKTIHACKDPIFNRHEYFKVPRSKVKFLNQ